MPAESSDWPSPKYGGCFKCHAAVANGAVALTNKELADAYQNMQEWQAIGYTPMVGGVLVVGGAEAAGLVGASVQLGSSAIGQAGVRQVLRILNDPSAQTEVPVNLRIGSQVQFLWARLDIVTQNAIHEVKNVAALSLNQAFTDQALKYKAIAESMGYELHYWLMSDAPASVVQWLLRRGIIVHTGG